MRGANAVALLARTSMTPLARAGEPFTATGTVTAKKGCYVTTTSAVIRSAGRRRDRAVGVAYGSDRGATSGETRWTKVRMRGDKLNWVATQLLSTPDEDVRMNPPGMWGGPDAETVGSPLHAIERIHTGLVPPPGGTPSSSTSVHAERPYSWGHGRFRNDAWPLFRARRIAEADPGPHDVRLWIGQLGTDATRRQVVQMAAAPTTNHATFVAPVRQKPHLPPAS